MSYFPLFKISLIFCINMVLSFLKLSTLYSSLNVSKPLNSQSWIIYSPSPALALPSNRLTQAFHFVVYWNVFCLSLFLDPPTLEVGPIDWPLSVCVRPVYLLGVLRYLLVVRAFGRHSLVMGELFVYIRCLSGVFLKTDHRIFPKLGMKLKDSKGNKVTEPNFPKKIWIIQHFSKIWSKMRFFDFCRKSKSLTPTFFDWKL